MKTTEKTYFVYNTTTFKKIKDMYKKFKTSSDLNKNEKETGMHILINIALANKNIDRKYKESKTKLTKEEWLKNIITKGGDK